MSEATYSIIAFYKFVHLPDYRELQAPLLEFCSTRGILGSILLAQEGINGTVSGTAQAIAAVKDYLLSDGRFAGMVFKTSYAEFQPFGKMRVRLKKEIVRLKVEGIDPTRCVGEYVEPEEWNDLIRQDDVILVDTRNAYEYSVGTFQGALNPMTRSFGQFPDYVQQNLDPSKHKRVAMFCTGGIRCEKATALMLQLGFQEVYHLKGGILNYLERVPRDESLWQGECFVFDERISVDHQLEKGATEFCRKCNAPINPPIGNAQDCGCGCGCEDD